MKSKRKFRRLSIMGLARLVLPGERKSQEVYVANVSRGGVGVYYNKALKLNMPVTITVPFPHPETGQHVEQTRTGIVLWCKRCGGVYAMGIKFDKIADQ